MTNYNNKKQINLYYFIPFFFILSINGIHATTKPALRKRVYTHEHSSRTNKHSGFISKTNESLDNNRKKRKYYTSVYEKNNIDRFVSSSAYKNFLTRLSVKKVTTGIYKKLFEKDFKDKEKKIKDNKKMISVTNNYLLQRINEYNEMVTQDKKLNIPAHLKNS